jgi:hypothetical protein
MREKENLNLDYKASAALDFDNRTPFRDGRRNIGAKHREELIKDVSAMAKAEGGIIVYGIEEEDDGYPKRVDDGFAGTKTGERIEQILATNIHPRLEGCAIHQIPLDRREMASRRSRSNLKPLRLGFSPPAHQ